MACASHIDSEDCSPGSPSAASWERMCRDALAGNPAHLLQTLLNPTREDGHGNPWPGSYYDLPQDGELRMLIVNTLIFGPWKEAASINDLVLKTGWGKGKPRVSDDEIYRLGLPLTLLSGEERRAFLESVAASYGVTPETIERRVRELRKREGRGRSTAKR